MSEELIEQLARRLAEIFVMSLQEPVTPPGANDFPNPTFYDMKPVARECLRQMEWARRTYLVIAGDGPEPGGHNCDEACYQRMQKLPLTLAPLDWQP